MVVGKKTEGDLVPWQRCSPASRGHGRFQPTTSIGGGGGCTNISLEESTFGGLGFGLLLEETSQNWLY